MGKIDEFAGLLTRLAGDAPPPASVIQEALQQAGGAAQDVLGRLSGQAPEPQYIRAYHGSPYDFDRFDASKIGTGEGAQVYGHGLYFAQKEDVARGYRNALRWRDWDTSDPAKRASMWIEARGGRDEALAALQDAIDKSYFGRDSLDARLNQSAIDYLRGGGQTPPPPPGRMYEVEIAHPESALLDWDRPLKSQGSLVSERLAPFRTGKYDLGPDADYESGATAVERIASAFDSDMAEASQALRRAGIPGIKYWDAGSRSAHQGTRNYVVFPGAEDSIRILRKFAVPGVVGAGAASMSGDGDQ